MDAQETSQNKGKAKELTFLLPITQNVRMCNLLAYICRLILLREQSSYYQGQNISNPNLTSGIPYGGRSRKKILCGLIYRTNPPPQTQLTSCLGIDSRICED